MSDTWANAVGLPTDRNSIIGVLEVQARVRANSAFITAGEITLTFGQLADQARRAATGFAALGVSKGDIVVLYMQNSAELVVSTFALAYLGAAASPINTEYLGEPLSYVVNDTTASVAVVDAELIDRFWGAADRYDTLGSKAGSLVVNGPMPTDAPEIPTVGTVIAFEDLVESDPMDTPVETNQSDLYLVLYTGGTTGRAKGVMVSNGHMLAVGAGWIKSVEYSPDDALYTCLPLFHMLGYGLGVIPSLLMGTRIYIDQRFSASGFWPRVKETGATVVHTIFSLIPILLSREPSPSDRDHSCRLAYIGPSIYGERFRERFGAHLVEAYGQSETGFITWGEVGEVPYGSCGRANEALFDVRIVDELDNELPAGETGEVVVRPRYPYTTMLGYLGQPQITADTFRNLWHHSGDRMYRDENSWFYFVDRVKDGIRRRGENISSHDVEVVVNGSSQVAESAVYAVPGELEEEEVKVAIVPTNPDSFDYAKFKEFCKDAMPRFMQPRYVELIEEVPKTPGTLKVEKYKLKEAGILGPTGKTWDLNTGEQVEQHDSEAEEDPA